MATDPATTMPTVQGTHTKKPEHFKVQVRKLIDICAELGLDYQELHPRERFRYSYTIVHRARTHQRSVELDLDPVFKATLANVVDLGYGLLLIDQRFLAIDTKHLPWPEAKIFTLMVKEIDPDSAIVRLPPKMARISHGTTPTLLSSHSNYYHWTLEALGQIALMVREAGSEKRSIVVGETRPYQMDSLKQVAPNFHFRVELPPYPMPTSFDRIVYYSHLSRDQVTHPLAVELLRRKFEIGVVEPQPRKWLYLDRPDNGRASLRNARAIRDFLSSQAFEIVDTAKMSFDEQRLYFQDAEIIVAPGGAALTNLLFCSSSAKVIVLGSVMGTFETFCSLAAAIGMETWLCLGSVVDWVPNSFFVWAEWGFIVETSDLALSLQQCKAALHNTDTQLAPPRAIPAN